MKFFDVYLAVTVIFFSAACTRYDHNVPDTEANRKVFRMLTGITPGKEISHIYAYADEFGADPLYCAAFMTTAQVVEQIVQNLKMQKHPSSADGTPSGPENISWWNSKERQKSQLYKAENKKQRVIYCLWHDRQTGKCQLLKWCY